MMKTHKKFHLISRTEMKEIKGGGNKIPLCGDYRCPDLFRCPPSRCGCLEGRCTLI